MSSRVWVITGTTSGFGLAIALCALKQGDKVIATSRSLTKFPKELEEAGAKSLVLDLQASDDDIRKTAEKALQIYGHVDVVINNAGTGAFGYGPVEELQMSGMRDEFQVNFFAHVAFTQPFIAHFRTRRTGCIINVSSMVGIQGTPTMSSYSASKAALDAYSDSLRDELRLFNVRVYNLLPGIFHTSIWRTNPAAAEDLARRDGAAEDLAHRDGAAVEAASKVYTDPSQGFDVANALAHSETKGDPMKLAERVYEIVAETGLAEKIMGRYDGHPSWTRVPFGSDAGQMVLEKAQDIADNVKAYEALWRSTDPVKESDHTPAARY